MNGQRRATLESTECCEEQFDSFVRVQGANIAEADLLRSFLRFVAWKEPHSIFDVNYLVRRQAAADVSAKEEFARCDE